MLEFVKRGLIAGVSWADLFLRENAETKVVCGDNISGINRLRCSTRADL